MSKHFHFMTKDPGPLTSFTAVVALRMRFVAEARRQSALLGPSMLRLSESQLRIARDSGGYLQHFPVISHF